MSNIMKTKLLEAKIQVENEPELGSDSLKRILALSGVVSENPSSPAFTGKIIETTATIVKKKKLTEAQIAPSQNFIQQLQNASEQQLKDTCEYFGIDCYDNTKSEIVDILIHSLEPKDQMQLSDMLSNIADQEYMNVVDRDFERDTNYDPRQLNDAMYDVEIDEEPDELEEMINNDYGHRHNKKTFHRIDAFDHKAFALDADKPDKYKSPRFGSNALANPVKESVQYILSESISKPEIQLFENALSKIKNNSASTMSESEIVAFTNAFISMLEETNDQKLRAIFRNFKE